MIQFYFAIMYSLEQKRNNPLNNSSSKQLFSFSRSDRFAAPLRSASPDAFYDPHPKASQPSFSFGRSNRLKTESASKEVPSQHFYNIEGEIERAIRRKTGIKILYGREECKSKGIFQVSESPGPGNYNPNPQVIKPRIASECSIGHDLRKKTIKEDPLPGPGSYHFTSTLLNEGKLLSKYPKHSYGKMLFEETRPARSKTEMRASPSLRFPDINYRGQQTFQKGKGFAIGKSQRFPQKTDSLKPGPGSYKIFTEFAQISKS